MPSKDDCLYGQPRPYKQTAPQPPNASSSAFSTALSALISSGPAKAQQQIPKPSAQPRDRNDIFKVHNRGLGKRAAKDMLGVDQNHSTSSEPIDDLAWRRTKQKMDEKARLYGALKRGDVEDTDGKYGVDFDRKYMEREDQGLSDQSDDDDIDADRAGSDIEERVASLKEEVTYVDKFGRTRTTTRAEMMRLEKQRARASRAAAALEEDQARPSAPQNVIYGDAIQYHAFNPDEEVSKRMADMAARRDREETPPEAKHYDASQDVRTRGTGFYQFSKDEEERKRQMDDLERLRTRTEASRGNLEDREALRKKRAAELEARRREIQSRKQKMHSDQRVFKRASDT